MGDRRGFTHSFGVSPRAHCCQGDEAGGAAVTWSVVRGWQIVIDGLGHVNNYKLVFSGLGLERDPMGRLGGIVPAYGKEEAYTVPAKEVQRR